MLTDLYLTGHLADDEGRPCPVGVTRPDDPVLRAALDEIGANEPKGWMQAVARDQRKVPGLVRSQLEAGGWLWVQRRRVLGIIPSARLRLHDEDLVSGLADQVTAALRNAIAGRPADERPLAVGLIGALGQLPTVFGFDEACAPLLGAGAPRRSRHSAHHRHARGHRRCSHCHQGERHGPLPHMRQRHNRP